MKVNYVSFLTPESKYLSPKQISAPTEFITKVSSMIKCMHESIILLDVGQRAVLTCPKDYAYGYYGIPGYVRPNSTLRLIVELIDC